MFNEFLNELKRKGINISFSESKVKYNGPVQYINNELIDNLKKFRGKLIRHLWPSECTNMMPINTEGSKTPFVLLHGERMNYPLSNALGIDQPFYGFFHYGSEGEKIFHRRVEEFARDYINQLQKIIPNGPYFLGGFSFGGLIAFEMAIQLQNRGFDVPVLILIDCKVPSLKEPLKVVSAIPKMSYKLYNLAKEYYYWLFHKSRRIYYEFFLMFRSRLHKRQRNYYIMGTYMDIARRYLPKKKYKGEILLFRSKQNSSVHEYLGWDSLSDKVKVHMVEGNHHTLYESEESYNVLSKNIDEWLQKAY